MNLKKYLDRGYVKSGSGTKINESSVEDYN